MTIENFISTSEGKWRSMRSGHSLAFNQFEEVVGQIEITCLKKNDPEVIQLLNNNVAQISQIVSPFRINWESESNWQEESNSQVISGSSIFVPIPSTTNKGIIIKSQGYAESIQATSEYEFTQDDTLILSTSYNHSIAEERIWFASKNVRCRASVIRTSEGSGVLQTSYASEIRLTNLSKGNKSK